MQRWKEDLSSRHDTILTSAIRFCDKVTLTPPLYSVALAGIACVQLHDKDRVKALEMQGLFHRYTCMLCVFNVCCALPMRVPPVRCTPCTRARAFGRIPEP